MASFAEGYHRHGSSSLASVTTSFLNSGKYSVNPEMRAKMIVKVTQKTNMEFCKAFWSLTENYGLQVRKCLINTILFINLVASSTSNSIDRFLPRKNCHGGTKFA